MAHVLARHDYPALSCAGCAELRPEGFVPYCDEPSGCPVPAPDERGRRALRLRQALHAFRGLINARDVLSMCGASADDAEVLAALERGLSEIRHKEAEG